MYSYNDGSVWAVTSSYVPLPGAKVIAEVWDVTGVRLESASFTVPAMPGDATMHVGSLSQPTNASAAVYFVRVRVQTGDGGASAWNTYWLSTTPDVLEWDQSNFYITPCSSYADFTALQHLPPSNVSVTTHTAEARGGSATTQTTVSLVNHGGVAFAGNVVITAGSGGAEVIPVQWTDNFVTLMPGDTLSLTAAYDCDAVCQREGPAVAISWWNDVVGTSATE